MHQSSKYIIGIDEVGRGCLAGPVIVAAVLLPPRYAIRDKRLGKLRDSKRLTALQRERWHSCFRKDHRVKYAVSRVNPRAIERLNISQAANLAALRAFNKLLARTHLHAKNMRVFLDGALYLGKNKKGNGIFARTVIKGDQKMRAVAIASIMAKVSRDRLMKRLSLRYPGYGFHVHKGYATQKHYAALKQFGPCEIHRLTFLRFLQNSNR